MPGWNLGAGYSYNENESPDGDVLSRLALKHLLKAWTSVRLPGVLSRWQIGGSLHAQSDTTSRRIVCSNASIVCDPVYGAQPAYAVFDVRAGFDVNRHWRWPSA